MWTKESLNALGLIQGESESESELQEWGETAASSVLAFEMLLIKNLTSQAQVGSWEWKTWKEMSKILPPAVQPRNSSPPRERTASGVWGMHG